jgi:hypothetical protein
VKLRFLIDENLSPRLKATINRHYPTVDVVRVGDEDAPPLGTPDTDLLLYLERTQRALITDNRDSMPGHIADHFAQGRQHWGIFEVHKNVPFGSLAELMYLYWEVTEAEEWINPVEWLVI